MGMFDFLKKKPEPPQKKRPIADAAVKQTKSAKDTATEKGEPYVAILGMDVDPNDIQNGVQGNVSQLRRYLAVNRDDGRRGPGRGCGVPVAGGSMKAAGPSCWPSSRE